MHKNWSRLITCHILNHALNYEELGYKTISLWETKLQHIGTTPRLTVRLSLNSCIIKVLSLYVSSFNMSNNAMASSKDCKQQVGKLLQGTTQGGRYSWRVLGVNRVLASSKEHTHTEPHTVIETTAQQLQGIYSRAYLPPRHAWHVNCMYYFWKCQGLHP